MSDLPPLNNSVRSINLNHDAEQTNYDYEKREINVKPDTPKDLIDEVNVLSSDVKVLVDRPLADLLQHNYQAYREQGALWMLDSKQNTAYICVDMNILQSAVTESQRLGLDIHINGFEMGSIELLKLLMRTDEDLWADFSDLGENSFSSTEVKQIFERLRIVGTNYLKETPQDSFNYSKVLHESTHAARHQDSLAESALSSFNRCVAFICDKHGGYVPSELRGEIEDLHLNDFKLQTLYELEAIINEVNAFEGVNDQDFNGGRYAYRLAHVLNELRTSYRYDYSHLDYFFVNLLEGNMQVDEKMSSHQFATILLLLGEENFDEYTETLLRDITINSDGDDNKSLLNRAHSMTGNIIAKIEKQITDLEFGKKPINISNSFYQKISKAIKLKQLEVIDTAQEIIIKNDNKEIG
jgi:hypothetical protein